MISSRIAVEAVKPTITFPCVMKWVGHKKDEGGDLIVLFSAPRDGIRLVSTYARSSPITGVTEGFADANNPAYWELFNGSIEFKNS